MPSAAKHLQSFETIRDMRILRRDLIGTQNDTNCMFHFLP